MCVYGPGCVSMGGVVCVRGVWCVLEGCGVC